MASLLAVSLFEAIAEWRKPQERHHCILIGPVYNGKASCSLNRRVIHLRLLEKEIECADVAAVMGGKGSIREVEVLGRITVPLIGNLDLVPDWIHWILQDVKGEAGHERLLELVLDGIKHRIATTEKCPEDEESITLDILKATVVNRMKDKVFFYREPRSIL
jgi:hypothetical protein